VNIDLAEAIRLYATRSALDLDSYLLSKSNHNLIAMLADLLTTYMNDVNSSTLRQFVTVALSGYTPTERKLGYNGYRQSTLVTGGTEVCEAKPVNVRPGTRKRLNGGGSFSDYTPERLERDFKANPRLLVSGFVDGRLIYIIEFPFRCPSFVAELRGHLRRAFPSGAREPNRFLRSANFNFRHYKDCQDLEVHFVASDDILRETRENFTRDFLRFLTAKR
jgi:hypothetical protein